MNFSKAQAETLRKLISVYGNGEQDLSRYSLIEEELQLRNNIDNIMLD